jgi:AraC-like DNA-binding protein/mannose-6-phosphate isomerase-like protein (cupin superfamily)
MARDNRTVFHDPDLDIEAYRFEGVMQKFPPHFHEYYVFGFIEKGTRQLICRGTEYAIHPGDILIFNPYDTHSCEQIDAESLDYRCLNISTSVIKRIMREIQGERNLPYFQQNVLHDEAIANVLKELHMNILEQDKEFKKEELFLYLMELLLKTNSDIALPSAKTDTSAEIQTICEYLENNYAKVIRLEALSQMTHKSKYQLLRIFTKEKGITPYHYLETIRINEAKSFLEKEIKPIEVAALTGFSDQSHFTKSFKKRIGLTPKQYMKSFESKGMI